jgi:hypothetical protein
MPRDVHRVFEDRLHAAARRHFSRFPGVYHVDLRHLAALGGGDMERGEQILGRMFRLVGPRSLHPDAVRELGNGSIANGNRVLDKFIARAQQSHQQSDSADDDHDVHGHGEKALVSQTEADYTDHGTKQEHCAICRHYLNRNACEIVAGHIQPQGWCKYFAKEAA